MNKNKTPTQLMIEAASARNTRERCVEWRPGVEELARLIAETLMAQIPAGAEGELNAWLRTNAGAQALRESWPRAVEAYLARGSVGADVTL